MEFEFDKEIDFLLRQTARSETAFDETIPDSRFQIPDSNHPDADEISAFAENALPEKIRQSYVLHLADCGRCRKSLAGLIALNGAAESAIIYAQEPLKAAISAPKIPWYRQFFAAPRLAYSLGALIVVFAGIGIFTILQNDNSTNSQVSQISEKQIGGSKGMSSDGDAATQEIYGNRMSSNTAAASNRSSKSSDMTANSANSATPSAPLMQANSNAMAVRREADRTTKQEPEADKLMSKPSELTGSVSAGAPPPNSASNDFSLDGADEKQPSNLSQSSGTQNQTAQNQTQITPDTRNVQRAPMPSAKMQSRAADSDETKKTVRDKSAEITIVGGKNFTRAGNVWIDAAFRGQTTTNVSRGTKEYRKLDLGLRGIVENLGGTVIVVWKEKAFRIQ